VGDANYAQGMEWVLLAVIVALGGLFYVARRLQGDQRRLRNDRDLALVKAVADEDVTRFGEELQDLHVETLATELDPAMRQDYQRALDTYENAKTLLHDATRPEDVTEVTKTLEEGRYAKACVLARQHGEALPTRRPPCFFSPGHGPSQTEVSWAPPGGLPREVPVCLADAERLAQGAEPDARMVRSGNKMVPWYDGGPGYRSYAQGYYGSWATNGLFPAFVLGSMMGGWGSDGSGSDFGGDSGGDDGSGYDGGGDSGSDGGGFDGGGFDGGGFDGGGFDGGF